MTGRLELTPSEIGIVFALGDGLTQAEIADERGVSVSTIHMQIKTAKVKLGARTTPHLVALAYHRGLLIVPERTRA